MDCSISLVAVRAAVVTSLPMRKTNRSQKKLSLTKQTVKQLTQTMTDEQLKNAAGGTRDTRPTAARGCGIE